MLKLAAFADEISPKLEEQVSFCKANAITHFELRSVSKVNVLDFDLAIRAQIREFLRANNVGVVSIGSPIGKIKVTDAWQPHFDRFKYAVDSAEFYGAPFIRIF